MLLVFVAALWWQASAAPFIHAWQAGDGVGNGREERLSRAQIELIETQLIPAIAMQNHALVIEVGAAFAGRLSDARRELADGYLETRGNPKLSVVLAAARIALAEQGYMQAITVPPRGRELLLTLSGVDALLEDLYQDVRHRRAMSLDRYQLEGFDEFESVLWELHTLRNLLLNAQRVAEYGVELAKGTTRVSTANLSQADRAALEIDFDRHRTRIVRLKHELEERDMDARLGRLEHSVDILAEGLELKERFRAAFSIDEDGPTLAKFLQDLAAAKARNPEREVIQFRQRLADPELPQYVNRLVADGTRAAGDDLLLKARLFYSGLHWWLRGRYGIGPEAGGLLKPRIAVHSPEAMFSLYMPMIMPDPRRPDWGQSTGQPPGYQYVDNFGRRHYYLWQIGFQRFLPRVNSDTNTERERLDTTPISTDYFW